MCTFANEMNETKKGFIQLHLSVLLAGFTGLFGRLITAKRLKALVQFSGIREQIPDSILRKHSTL